MMGLVLAASSFGRPFAAPPGLPPATLAHWRRAFEETARDPALLEEARANKATVRYAAPAIIDTLLATAASLDAPTIARLRTAYSGAAARPQ